MDIADHIRRDPEEGARRLVSELGPGLYGVALRLVGDDRAAADDLYMRALECAFAKIVQYRGDGLFLWLRAILVNIRRMDLRRRGRDLPVPDDEIDLDALPGESPEPFSALLARSDADAVRAAVARLPLPYRRAVLLRYWRDLAVPEVAAALALPANPVKTHLARARALLRADLAPILGKEPSP